MRAIRIKRNIDVTDQPGHLTQMVEICQDDITTEETMDWISEMIGNQEPIFCKSDFLKKVGMPESFVIISGADQQLGLNEVATYMAAGKEIYGNALFINFHEDDSEYRFEEITFRQSSDLIPEFVRYCVLADEGKLGKETVA